jgi:hypothetical protein
MKLKLKDATIVNLTKYPGEEACTQVLVLAALLTPPIAEKLKCREACYTDEGVPRKFDAYPSPAVRISGADVLMGDTSARANLIHKFKIAQPKAGGETDTSLELRMRLHFDGHLPLGDFLDSQNKQPFLLSINARQEDLDFGDQAEEAEAETDEAEPDTGCVACNNDIPMGIGNRHVTGAKCTKPAESEPALASAREAAGGTHQRKRGAAQQSVQ